MNFLNIRKKNLISYKNLKSASYIKSPILCPKTFMSNDKYSGEILSGLIQEDFKIVNGLETPIQLIYFGILIYLLLTAGFILFRKVLVRYELGEAAKILGEKIRTGNACSSEYFELGAIMMRLKLYSQAISNLENCIKYWDYEQIELAQVYNALGFAYMETNQLDKASSAYIEAVRLQPGYTTARNNLGKIFEVKKDYRSALDCYKVTLAFNKNNVVANRQKLYCMKNLKIRNKN